MRAVIEMRRMQREAASIADEPLARAQWRYFNGHRGKDAPEMPIEQFRCYVLDAAGNDGSGSITARAAAAVMALANEGKCPAYVLPAWDKVLAVVTAQPATAPDCKLLQSADGMLSVIAPEFIDQGVRGGLVAAGKQMSGEVVLHDVDRPLLTWRVVVPTRQGAGWIEAGMLLLTAT